jgi:hypothetical protein
MAEALFRSDFVELNQTGVLSVQIEQNEDATARAWQAGVQGVECRLNYVANAVRLTVIYNFILGSEVMQI